MKKNNSIRRIPVGLCRLLIPALSVLLFTWAGINPAWTQSLYVTSGGGTVSPSYTTVSIAATAEVYSGPNLTGATVSIISGFVSGEDVLGVSGTTIGTDGSISYSYNATSGVLTLMGSTTAANYQTTIRKVTYTNSAALPNTTSRVITVSLNPALPFSGNGHYYEYITSSQITWTNAMNGAAAKNYFGLQGYLATITSEAENTFCASKIGADGAWLGGNAAAGDGTDWKWVTGPESGTQFWEGINFGSAIAGQYANWREGEPNSNLHGEDYLQFFPSANGKWNNLSGLASSFISGYIVEYGGTTGDPVLHISDNVTVNFQPVTSLSVSGSRTVTAQNQEVYIAPNALVTGSNLDGARVTISNFVSGQDVLRIDGETSGTDGSITYSFDSGVLTLAGSTTTANYQTTLRKVTYSNSSVTPTTTARTVNITLGANQPYSGHYYEFKSSPGITWTDAKTAAESFYYLGKRGYLATIGSAGENTFVYSKINDWGWLGGNDAASEGVWKWVTGPEAGTQFWQGARIGGTVVGGKYTNWGDGQPDNAEGVENYLHFWTGDTWNDFPNISSDLMLGYLVEYGGMPGDAVLNISGNVAVYFAATITTSGSLTKFTSCSGKASVEKFFTASRSYTTADISVTAPTGYEVCTTADGTYSTGLTLTKTGETAASWDVYVRLTSSASGSPAGDISLSSSNATTNIVHVSGEVSLPSVGGTVKW